MILLELPLSDNPTKTSFSSPRPWIWRENIEFDPLSSEEMVRSDPSVFKAMDEIGFLSNIESIQVQPHDFDNNATKKLLNMHRILHKTHTLKLSYPFVWDFWQLKK